MWFEQWAVNFFGIGSLLSLYSSNELNVHSLSTVQGIEAFISPIFPIMLVLEIAFLMWINRRTPNLISFDYKIPVLMYLVNAIIAAYITLDIFLWTFSYFSKLALFTVEFRFRYFLYAYVVWELSHFVFHFTAHKVRFLWIIHAPHHAPARMNLSVIFTSFFLQGTYATFVRTAICALFGIPMPLLILVMVIDGCWGALIHISEEVWNKGTPGGILGKIFLWPSDHRVHHACNPQYIDMNYCNTLPIWDMVFRTRQREMPLVKPLYGLARKINQNSFKDTYFGELDLLVQDIIDSRNLKNALGYIFMPPGWKPKDDSIQNTTIHTLRRSIAPALIGVICVGAFIGNVHFTNSAAKSESETFESYPATLVEGIQFSDKHGYPSFIKSVVGMSQFETSGRWTEKKNVVFTFQQNLPSNFTLTLEMVNAFEPIVGKDIQIKVGDWNGRLSGDSKPSTVNFAILTNNPTDKIEFIIPEPKSPKELGMSSDGRTLGIMFKRLSVNADK